MQGNLLEKRGSLRRQVSEEPCRVAGTNLVWTSLADWLRLVDQVGGILRPSSRHYARCRALYYSLSIEDIRGCLDSVALKEAVLLFDRARHRREGLEHGPSREMSRAELGARLVECRNQLQRVESGRATLPRIRGPRFDPALLPDTALDRLIQRHPDLGVVELLREQRRQRRQMPATSGGDIVLI